MNNRWNNLSEANMHVNKPESSDKSFVLNEETMKGKWKEVKGGVQKMWGQLTDDELEKAKGDVTALSGIIQQRYGESKETVQTKLNDYFKTAWSDVLTRVSDGAEKAHDVVREASDNSKHKL
ncbi:MAG: CsbD family protein [Bdellovibrionales bacterium]|nr:CsbD family protein [Bdellovibrionales bacterium]